MNLTDLPLDFPRSTVSIAGWENWLFCDAIGAKPSYTVVHPGLGFLVCARSSSVSLLDLLTMVGSDPANGPMLVGSQIESSSPLEIDVDYEVGHRLVSLERKQGKAIGPFDLLTHRFTLERHETRVFSYVGRMALPRSS